MKATNPQVHQRIEEVLRIRLDGAEFWDVREYVREKEQVEGSAWQLPAGRKPLSDATLWRYIGKADRLIAESCRSSRKKLLRRHLAQRRNLFAKALSAGDYRAALAAARDEAELQGLYPAKKAEVTGKGGTPIVLTVVEEVVGRAPAAALPGIVEEVVNNGSSPPAGTNDPFASRAASLPPQ
jgi:hypothetical protein